ncbi:MAG: RagB/SusD family nutrient uptake outer membrane protein [Spirosomataceae bacterium]
MKKSVLKFVLGGSIIALSLSSLQGCRDYLEVQPQSQIGIAEAFSSVANVRNAIIGVYDELMGDNGYGIRLNLYYPFDSDEMYVSGNLDNGRRGIGRYQLLLTNAELRNPFLQLYRGVEKANLCIEQIPQMTLYSQGSESEKAELRRMHGEALVLRAQFLFELIRNWGDVPAPMIPAYRQTDLFLSQNNRDETYEKLIADLATAIELLPWRTEVPRDERITKGAAKALRAKLALFRGGFALRENGQMVRGSNHLEYYRIARQECADLMARRDQHTLNPNFQDIWRRFLSSFQLDPFGEILFEVGAGGSNSNSDSRMANYNGPRTDPNSRVGTGGGGLQVMPTLFYSYDSTDVRRDVSITLYAIPANNIKTPRRLGEITDGKFRKDWRNPLLPGTALNVGYNWPLIRFSDVLLMFAEAENELNNGPTPAAITAFQEVRNRSTRVPVLFPSTKDGFFQTIEQERFLEFAGEGIRKYDLIRWNLLDAKIKETRAKLERMKARTGEYSQVPRYMFWRNNGEELFFGNSFYRATNLTTAPAGFTRLDWAQHLTSNVIDGLPLDRAIARFFVSGKSELFPYPQSTVDSYQGKLKQNPGY